MMNKWTDEYYPALPVVNAGGLIHHSLYDEDTSPKKFTRSLTTPMTPEMLMALQELATNKNLPFQGVINNLSRHNQAAGIIALEEFLDGDMLSIWRNLTIQQRRLTRERVIVTIDEIIDQQVEQLQFWSRRGKWDEVIRSLKAFMGEVTDYPTNDWREHVAEMWLKNDGVKGLMRFWADKMRDEAPVAWIEMRELVDKMETYAGG